MFLRKKSRNIHDVLDNVIQTIFLSREIHKTSNTSEKQSIYYTGCFKKNGAVFILQISRQPNIGFSNRFFLLKTEIHM